VTSDQLFAKETIMQPRETLRNYFAGLSEQTFQTQLGVADPALIDYISDLLVRFVRSDAIYHIRNLTGQPLAQVACMVAEAENRIGEAKRDVHRHIGDFTLFWAGVYPEALRKMQSANKKDHLVDYCTHGKRAYWIASTLCPEDEECRADGAVLSRLSREFEMCAYGLREVRREWEKRDHDGDSPLPILLN
jgi:hypothetical protein